MPILEIVIRQLAQHGFKHITLAVNHMANLIIAFFGDGSKWGVRIDYSLEDKPLSTIGPLTLIDSLPESFIVMNGDILCDLDYRDFLDNHIKKACSVTVATFQRDVKVDFGVIGYNTDNVIDSFSEKPTYHFDVSMGIYGMSRHVIEALPRGEPYGFDDLMRDGLRNGLKMEARPYEGFWLDIGRPDDYDYANENYAMIKSKLGLC
jgi:NDP-sugar pyrophosphorylase family protein